MQCLTTIKTGSHRSELPRWQSPRWLSQEAQLLQRSRTMLHVIENFA